MLIEFNTWNFWNEKYDMEILLLDDNVDEEGWY